MTPPPSAKRGFALPAVLVVTGVVALVFLMAIAALDDLSRQTRHIAEETRFQAAALDLEARAAFLAAVTLPGPAALGQGEPRIDLDGRAYRAESGFLVGLQDEGGLINLDSLGPAAMPRLFAELGVPEAARPSMADRLADYIDPDDLKRPQGAEASDYRRGGLPSPADAPLTSLPEAFGVMGWRDEVRPEAAARARDILFADPEVSQVNVNTAPGPVLKVLFGLDDRGAEAALARRSRAPFVSLEDFGRTAGVRLVADAERVYTFPIGRFAVKITDPATGLAARARIVLTPDDPARPVWIQERSLLREPEARMPPPPADALRFPDPAG